jgi:thioredoxin reductase (NADPH)
VGGDELLARLTAQALAFGAQIREARADSLTAVDGGFAVSVAARAVEAPTVLLGAGVLDHLPDLPGIDAAIRRSLVRMCPICDAFEATDKRIAILGDGGLAQREADFLRTYTDDVTVIATGDGGFDFEGDSVLWSPAGGGRARVFDHLYLAMGCSPQSGLATACGARADETGNLIVDAHQMTSVEGLYAAGDLVRGLNQIAVATGEAAIAATAMHNRLRGVA